jgi:hypothetical protein
MPKTGDFNINVFRRTRTVRTADTFTHRGDLFWFCVPTVCSQRSDNHLSKRIVRNRTTAIFPTADTFTHRGGPVLVLRAHRLFTKIRQPPLQANRPKPDDCDISDGGHVHAQGGTRFGFACPPFVAQEHSDAYGPLPTAPFHQRMSRTEPRSMSVTGTIETAGGSPGSRINPSNVRTAMRPMSSSGT